MASFGHTLAHAPHPVHFDSYEAILAIVLLAITTVLVID
jgi:hypothetical protein